MNTGEVRQVWTRRQPLCSRGGLVTGVMDVSLVARLHADDGAVSAIRARVGGGRSGGRCAATARLHVSCLQEFTGVQRRPCDSLQGGLRWNALPVRAVVRHGGLTSYEDVLEARLGAMSRSDRADRHEPERRSRPRVRQRRGHLRPHHARCPRVALPPRPAGARRARSTNRLEEAVPDPGPALT